MSLREWAWVGVAVLCALGWLARPLSSEAVIGALFGAAIGAVISWYFYRQAGDELKDIHAQTASMLQSISGGHKITVDRDEQGKTRVTHHVEISNVLDTTDSVHLGTESDEDGDPKNVG
jgi:hypothetical protein